MDRSASIKGEISMNGKSGKFQEIKWRPRADYRGFSLSRLNEPRFVHLKLLLGWAAYFALFILTEKLIPAERCTPVHCALDDIIPFCEVFVIPYVLWYFLIIGTLVYFALYNVESFSVIQRYFIIIQALAAAVYIIFPTRQDLRPDVFENNNIFTDIVRFIYSVDTNTGVCPSMHVACSVGIASVWMRERKISCAFKGIMAMLCFSICLSTVFIKQHSALDGFAAIPICMIAGRRVFHREGKTQKRPL